MLNREQVGEVVEELVTARSAGDNDRATGILDRLTRGGSPVVDALNVTLVLAGVVAEDVGGWCSPATRATLPPHVNAFLLMVFALALGDSRDARRIFLTYVDGDWQRALSVLVFGANQVAHCQDDCDCTPTPEGVGG